MKYPPSDPKRGEAAGTNTHRLTNILAPQQADRLLNDTPTSTWSGLNAPDADVMRLVKSKTRGVLILIDGLENHSDLFDREALGQRIVSETREIAHLAFLAVA